MKANDLGSSTGFFRLLMRNYFDSKPSYADFHCHWSTE